MSTRKGKYGNPANRRPLVGELRARAQPTGVADPRTLGGDMSGPGGPWERDAVIIDPTDAVYLETCDVTKVEGVRSGVMSGALTFMTLGGRVHKTDRRVRVGFFFGPDGAAALITQLLALADRDGAEMLDDLTRRLTELHQERTVDLAFLRAAIDNAMEADRP